MKPTVLLEKYIKLILEADDVSTKVTKVTPKNKQPGQLPQVKPGTFDFGIFKKIENPQRMWEYAKATLESIGEGSSREVFRLTDKFALKVAIGETPQTVNAGQKQNRAELGRCSADPEHNRFLAKVYPEQSDEETGNWLVVDLAKPMTEEGEFQSLTGINWDIFASAIAGAVDHGAGDSERHDAQVLSKNKFFSEIIHTIKDCKFQFGDVAKLGNWGIVNNRPVLLDYGFTQGLLGKIQTVRHAR